MIIGYFRGFGDPVSNRQKVKKKEWVMAAASLAGGLAKSLFGGARSRKLRKQAERAQEAARNNERAWYGKQYNVDYIDTEAGSRMLSRAQEIQDAALRRTDGAAAVGGASDASVAQAKESANKTMSDTVADIAAQDTARKQSVADTHARNMQAQAQADIASKQEQAQQASDAAQQASNAAMTAAGSLLSSANTLSKSKLQSTDSAASNTIANTSTQEMLRRSDVQTPVDAVSKLSPRIDTTKLQSAAGV